jgi:hypothetical protein
MHFPTFTILAATLSLTSVIANPINPVVTLAVRDGNVARHAAFQGVAKRQDDGTGETGETGTGETGTGETGTGEEGTGSGEEAGTEDEGTGEDIESCKSDPSPVSDRS